MVGLLYPARHGGHTVSEVKRTPRERAAGAPGLKTIGVRAVASAVMFTQAATPVTASMAVASAFATLYGAPLSRVWAQDPPELTFEESAALGEQTGEATLPGPRTDGDTVYFVDEDGLETMSALELFGGTGLSPDVAVLQSLSDDASGLNTYLGGARARIEGEDTELGSALRTATAAAGGRSHPDMSGDPAFSQTDSILNGSDPVFGTFFSGCTEVTVPTTTGTTVHVPEYEYCSRVTVPIESCELHHDYEVKLIDFSGLGSGRKAACGHGCFDLEIGTRTDNAWFGGACSMRTLSMSIRVENADAIDRVTLEEVVWDDYAQVNVNGSRVWAGPGGSFPVGLADCERDTNHRTTPGTDITSHFTGGDDRTVTMQLQVLVGDHGEGFARIRIEYDTAKAVVLDAWDITPECMGLVHGLNDGACQPLSMTCEDGPDHSIPCITVGEVQVCQTDLAPSPIHSGYSNLCRVGSVTADCRFYLGDLPCFRDAHGVLQCPTNTGGFENGCLDQESRTECAHVRSACLSSAGGASGRCYAWEETWDCGYDIGGAQGTARTLTCDGPIRCMGDECLTAAAEVNADFVTAATQLEAMQYGAMDFQCADDDPASCQIFTGGAFECKNALGGELEQDCCEQPGGVDLNAYLDFTEASWDLAKKLDQSGRLANAGANVAGAWEGLQNSAGATLSRVTEPFTSAWGSLTETWGSTAGVEGIQGVGLDSLKGEMVGKIGTFVENSFGENVASMIFDGSGGNWTGIGGSLGASAVMATVMWVYTIYTVVKLLARIVWRCEESELQLGIKRQLRSCTYIGEYCRHNSFFGCIEERRAFCCYQSPLSRIVSEQAIPQLGMNFGTPEAPNCSGLTVAQLQSLDWTRIDLSEWYGLLVSEGRLPMTSGEADNQYSLSNTTASPYDASRPNALERARDRADAVDADAARNTVRENLWRGIN